MIAKSLPATQWREPTEDDSSGKIRDTREWVAREAALIIVVNGEELVRLASSPTHCNDLALGYLITEGVIGGLADVVRSDHDPAQGVAAFTLAPHRPFHSADWRSRRTVSSGCGEGVTLGQNVPRVADGGEVAVPPEFFRRVFTILREDYSVWYERTGCIHLAALAISGGPLVIREDIGRHNAVDKVVGAAARLESPLASAVLCSTGRLSSDMIRKAAFAGIPVVASRSAPTSLAVDLAEASGITLVGFARRRRFNLYTHPERIIFDETTAEDMLSPGRASSENEREA
ncbi:formate dehydrogenase accessory sulfurtransferase FdhD [bacterium]|nr:formate dehydrogenase accessory sulfurtransferase FdhD [bacterium]MBU1983342.1 formate dehydrogenase accessory sulfurtransferase FdhD [bacterium]